MIPLQQFTKQFKRLFAGSLDVDDVFPTYQEMQDYLLSGNRYAGMKVACLEREGTIFILNNAKDQWVSSLEKVLAVAVAIAGYSGYIEASQHSFGKNISFNVYRYTSNETFEKVYIYHEVYPDGKIFYHSNTFLENTFAIIT